MYRLHSETALDKLIREIIEQFRMRRSHAHPSEVVWSADNAGTEVPKPDPINEHARGQRVRWISDPSRQSESRFIERFIEFWSAVGQENS